MRITLTTRGRRSGLSREVDLYAFEDGERLVITASWAGRPRDPAWVGNLRCQPRARVRRGRRGLDVEAHEAEGGERERRWRLVCEGFPMCASYQRRTSRRFPIFVLEPLGGPDVR